MWKNKIRLYDGKRREKVTNVTGNILHTIEESMSGFSKGQRRIASYILENYDTAAFMTAGKEFCSLMNWRNLTEILYRV